MREPPIINLNEAKNLFYDFLANKGHPLESNINDDSSKFHYFKCPFGDSTDARYKFYSDNIPCGYFHCWHCDIRDNFCSVQKERCSQEEWSKHEERIAQQKRDATKETEEGYTLISKLAKIVFQNADLEKADSNEYLMLKKVKNYGLRVVILEDENTRKVKVYPNTLLIPAFNEHKEHVNCERIYKKDNKFNKRPLSGGKRSGTYFLIGEIHGSQPEILIAEGYATAATVFEAMNLPTVVSFNAGNIPHVAKIFHKKYPTAKILIVTDDDKRKTNAGERYAKKALSSINGEYVIPDFDVLKINQDELENLKLTDFNDLFLTLLEKNFTKEQSLNEIKRQLINNRKRINVHQNQQSSNQQKKPAGILYEALSNIESRPIKWLWKGKFARGKYGVIAGHPGVGKSQLTANIAALVTTGGMWPDKTISERGSVIFLSAEDDAADTIRPRLEAAGANLNNVYFVKSVNDNIHITTNKNRLFNLDTDLEKLGLMIDEINYKEPEKNVSLIIIDPLTAYLGRTNSNNNAEVRGLLARVSELAEKYDIALLGVSHFTKGGNDTQALLRVCGSLAFVAAARFAFLVAKDNDDEYKRVFIPLKNNLAKDTGGHVFTIEPINFNNGIETSRIKWSSESITKSADEILGGQYDSGEKSALDEAIDFLRDLLAKGPVYQKDVKEAADKAGIAGKTLYRAKEKLKIISDKERGVAQGAWFRIYKE